MSTIHTPTTPKGSQEVHTPILEAIKAKGTPAYSDSVKRLLALGLTMEQAVDLLTE